MVNAFFWALVHLESEYESRILKSPSRLEFGLESDLSRGTDSPNTAICILVVCLGNKLLREKKVEAGEREN